MDNMQIGIMNIRKKIDSLKIQQKLVDEQEALSIFCPKCRKKILLRECPADLKCVICAGNHAIEKWASIPGLKVVFEGENSEPEPLHAMGARRNWSQVSVVMVPESSPQFFGHNAHLYSYYNTHQFQTC